MNEREAITKLLDETLEVERDSEGTIVGMCDDVMQAISGRLIDKWAEHQVKLEHLDYEAMAVAFRKLAASVYEYAQVYVSHNFGLGREYLYRVHFVYPCEYDVRAATAGEAIEKAMAELFEDFGVTDPVVERLYIVAPDQAKAES